jgi:hypothetical protein
MLSTSKSQLGQSLYPFCGPRVYNFTAPQSSGRKAVIIVLLATGIAYTPSHSGTLYFTGNGNTSSTPEQTPVGILETLPSVVKTDVFSTGHWLKGLVNQRAQAPHWGLFGGRRSNNVSGGSGEQGVANRDQ